MRPVNQLPLSLKEIKRSPLASSRKPDSPPKPRKPEVRTSPLRYSSVPNRRRERSRVSKDGSGRALTSIGTGAATEYSSGGGGFDGGWVANCAHAPPGIASVESPAAVDVRKRRRLGAARLFQEWSLRREPVAAGAAPWVSLNNSASFSVMAPPSSSASTMVTARR